MRLLIVTTLFPTPFDPWRSPFNRHQFQALAKQYPTRLLVPVAWTARAGAWHKRQPKACFDDSREDLNIHYASYWYPPKVGRRFYGHCYRWSIRSQFLRAIDEFQPTVILAAWAYPDGWAALSLGRESGLPVAIKVHGCDVLSGGKGLSTQIARDARTIEALREADGIVAVSQHLRTAVIRHGARPEKVQVVYNGIDSSTFCPGHRGESCARLGIPADDPLLLYVGRLEEEKAPGVLIAACDELRKMGRKFRCYFVGDGSLRKQLESEVQRRDLCTCVTFVGTQASGSLVHWYRAANVLALPSRSEGIPNVILEAHACGTPVVATRVGGVPELLERISGTLVEPDDPRALACAIENALHARPACSRAMSTASWETSAAELGRALCTIESGYGLESARSKRSAFVALDRPIHCS